MSYDEIDNLLNKKSGLIGICGDNDLRDIQERQEEGDPAAALALDMYCYRVKKYIGAYFASLNGLDALVFTAGAGENNKAVRWLSCFGLENLGICLDKRRNDQGIVGEVTEIQSKESRVKVLIIPTNEELEIAEQSFAVMMTD